MRHPKKLAVLTAILLAAPTLTTAQNMETESLELQGVPHTFTDNSIDFQVYGDTISLTPKQVFAPDQISDHVTFSGYNYQDAPTGDRVEWTGIEFEQYTDYGSEGANDLLGRGGSDATSSKYPSTYFQKGAFSSDIAENGSITDVFKYDYTLNKQNYNVTWDINLENHYEHLIINYKLKYTNSTTTETVQTWKNVYSGEDPEKLILKDSNILKYERNGEYQDKITLKNDRLYEQETKQVQAVVLSDSSQEYRGIETTNTNEIKQISSNGMYSKVENEAEKLNMTNVLVEDITNYQIHAYNITLKPNSTARIEAYQKSPKGVQGNMSIYLLGSFAGGSGSSSDPYQIETCQQLQDMENDLTASYELISDIDCSNTVNWDGGEGFDPIGYDADGNEFNGVLNGNNHVVKDLFITRVTKDDIGLLGKVGTDTIIKNIGLTNVDIDAQARAGGLVGNSYADKINNTFVSGGIVESDNTAGGLVGVNGGSGEDVAEIYNSYANVEVIAGNGGGNRAGGLVGRSYRPIINSYSAGSVSGDQDTGGLVGLNYGSSTDSYWDTEASGQTSSATGTGLTTSEMTYPNAETNMAFNFNSIWKRDDGTHNNGYPMLVGFCQVDNSCNKKPKINSYTFTPSNWSYGNSPSLEVNASDSDGSINTVNLTVKENSTTIVDSLSLTDSDSDGVWNASNPFTLDETSTTYEATITVEDDKGATVTQTETQTTPSNSPPTFTSKKAYRAFDKTGSLAYCGRTDVKYSSGSNTINFNDFKVEDTGKNHTLVVARIKNSNSMSVLVNNNQVGSLGSTTGSGCNNDNWIVNTLEVPASRISESTDLTFSPSGTTDNYIYYAALRENTETPLFKETWDYLVETQVSDPEGQPLNTLEETNTGFNILQYGYNPETNLGITYGSIPDTTNSKTLNFNTSDNNGLQNTASENLEIDYQKPSISQFTNYSEEKLINYNETATQVSLNSTISDPEGYLNQVTCNIGSAVTTVDNTNDQYNCTADIAQHGNIYPELYADDTVGHNNTRNTTIEVTKIDRTLQQVNTPNEIFVGNSSKGNNNLTTKPIQMRFKHKLDILGTANITAPIKQDIEATNLLNASIEGNQTVDLNTSERKLNYSLVTGNNQTNNDTSRNINIDVWAENFEFAYQNDQQDSNKRYFKLRTTNEYNYSISSQVTFRLPTSYDPYDKSIVLKKCTSVDTWNDYTCGGNWQTVKNTGKDINGDNNFEATTYETSFSENLFFVDLQNTAEKTEATSTDSATGSATASPTGNEVSGASSGIQGWLGKTYYTLNLGALTIPLNIFNMIMITIGGVLIWKRDEVQNELNGGGF